MTRAQILSLCILTFLAAVSGQSPTKWRGPGSDGIYPGTGLLKEWPEDGLQLLWSYDGMERGFTSPAISGGSIYMASMLGETGYLFKLTTDGKLVWKRPYGPEFTGRYPGARSTATVAGDLVYQLSGNGKLVCMNTSDGSLVWTKHLVDDLGGQLNRYGFSESVVIDGNTVYCTPGGLSQSVAALNRFTGQLIWKAPGKGDKAAYCTPLLIRYPSRTLLVTHTESHILGMDTRNGSLLWSFEWPNRMREHQNTPLYKNNELFCFSGYGKGAVMLTLGRDGLSVSQKWISTRFDNRMGGAVVIDGYIYGAGHNNRYWQCLDWTTGKEMYSSRELTMGVVIAAEKMLYCYDENGVLALVKPDPAKFNIVSRMKITLGSGSQWAHPVIHDGVLYIARGSTLMAYDINRKDALGRAHTNYSTRLVVRFSMEARGRNP